MAKHLKHQLSHPFIHDSEVEFMIKQLGDKPYKIKFLEKKKRGRMKAGEVRYRAIFVEEPKYFCSRGYKSTDGLEDLDNKPIGNPHAVWRSMRLAV